MNPLSNYPAINGEPVTEAHKRYCTTNGHAVHKVDGIEAPRCPRCGDLKTDIRAHVTGDLFYTVPSTSEHIQGWLSGRHLTWINGIPLGGTRGLLIEQALVITDTPATEIRTLVLTVWLGANMVEISLTEPDTFGTIS